MDSAFLSAIFGLVGVAIGGLTSFLTSWSIQRAQLREKRREVERGRREAIYNDFIAEASRLYGDALSHEKDDVTDMVKLYAMLGRIRLVASREVITAAELVMDAIIDAYLAPNRSLHEMREFAKQGGLNVLVAFGEACRDDLSGI